MGCMSDNDVYAVRPQPWARPLQGGDAARSSQRRPRVALGMSGGVDSSVTAALLMQAGYDVLGVTCLFTDGPTSQAAIADAQAVARELGIPHLVRDCRDLFARSVVDSFVRGYACGSTPSPCVHCNALVKIPALIMAAREAAQESGPCDFVATGHYARIEQCAGRFFAARAAHVDKDQSYMLSMLSQDQLSRLLLPLGWMAGGKPEVRRIAADLGLPIAAKSESQDICFIPDGNHQAFLERQGVQGGPGDIVTRTGEVVGRHAGLFRYTVGQRKGLGIGGAPRPYYVVEKDVEHNRIVVAFEEDSMIDRVRVAGMNWQLISPDELVRQSAEGGEYVCKVKLRYRQQAVSCRVVLGDGRPGSDGSGGDALGGSTRGSDDPESSIPGSGTGTASASDKGGQVVTVLLDQPQAPTAPGQFAVLYQGEAVLGAGMITNVDRIGAAPSEPALTAQAEERAIAQAEE